MDTDIRNHFPTNTSILDTGKKRDARYSQVTPDTQPGEENIREKPQKVIYYGDEEEVEMTNWEEEFKKHLEETK